MSPNGWFGHKPTFSTQTAGQKAGEIPEGLWIRCPECKDILFTKDLEKNLKVCKKCGYHFRLSVKERLDLLLDEDSFIETEDSLHTVNPLGFPEYESKITKWQNSSHLTEGMVTGKGQILGHELHVGVAAFSFGGASMGSVYGERTVRILEAGLADRLPVLMICSSGGARMQEGLISLMQMAKTSAAVAKFRDAGLLYITLLTDPTTAGVLASFASLGDVILAEPGALVGFAGARVAKKVQVEKPPENYQTSEFQMESGMLDLVVPRKDLRTTLGRILSFSRSPITSKFDEEKDTGKGEVIEGPPTR